jgi:hypothetical protein
MSMVSAWTIGAMASKKLRAPSPVRARIARRQAGDLLSADVDQGMGLQLRRHRLGEAFAVDRQGAAGRDLVRVGGCHDQRAAAAHFRVQQAHGVELPVV